MAQASFPHEGSTPQSSTPEEIRKLFPEKGVLNAPGVKFSKFLDDRQLKTVESVFARCKGCQKIIGDEGTCYMVPSDAFEQILKKPDAIKSHLAAPPEKALHAVKGDPLEQFIQLGGWTDLQNLPKNVPPHSISRALRPDEREIVNKLGFHTYRQPNPGGETFHALIDTAQLRQLELASVQRRDWGKDGYDGPGEQHMNARVTTSELAVIRRVFELHKVNFRSSVSQSQKGPKGEDLHRIWANSGDIKKLKQIGSVAQRTSPGAALGGPVRPLPTMPTSTTSRPMAHPSLSSDRMSGAGAPQRSSPLPPSGMTPIGDKPAEKLSKETLKDAEAYLRRTHPQLREGAFIETPYQDEATGEYCFQIMVLSDLGVHFPGELIRAKPDEIRRWLSE